MKRIIAAVALLCAGVFALQAIELKVPGFGKLVATEQGAEYSVELKNFGTFTFSGDITGETSFELVSKKVSLSQLGKFPGYKIFALLSLEDIQFKLTKAGLEISADVQTGGKLKTLVDMLGLPKTTMSITARVGVGGVELEGKLSAGSDKTVTLIPKAGTELGFKDLTITYKLGSPEKETKGFTVELTNIAITGHFSLKPSSADKLMGLELAFSYDLANQQIEMSGSLLDPWVNPFGIDRLLNGKGEISVGGAAIAVGWTPGSPTLTKFGIYAKNVNFFNIKDLSFAMDIDPTSGKGAYMFEKSQITLNDLKNYTAGGLGAILPDVFPSSLNLRNVRILFSPNGGSVGAYTIEKGMRLTGEANFGSACKASVNIYTDFRSAHLEASFDSKIRDMILDGLKDYPKIKFIMSKLTSTLSVKHVKLMLEAGADRFAGEFEVNLTVMGKNVSFSAAGSFDPAKVGKMVAEKIWTEVKNFAEDAYKEVVGDVKKVAVAAYNKTKTFLTGAVNKVWSAMKDFGTMVKHGTHSFNRCYGTCVPDYANNAGGKMLEAAMGAFRDNFMKDLLTKKPVLTDLDAADIKALREEIYNTSFNPLLVEINRQFDRVRDDREVRLFFTLGSSKDKGERRYEETINQYREKFNSYAKAEFDNFFKQ